jgi:predicted nucleic acid-binding protein
MNKAITDTGPPLHLNETGYIQLLKLFDTLLVSTQVKEELQDLGVWYSLTKQKAIHLQEEIIIDDEITKEQDRWKDLTLHRADVSVLVLVKRMADALALTDDLALRKAIESLGRVVVGSVGILIRGYREKRLSKDELHKGVDLLFNDSSLYLSRIFRDRVRKLVEELEETQRENEG